MKCLSPVQIVNPRYRAVGDKESSAVRGSFSLAVSSRNGVPDDYWLKVPCGRCFACIKDRSNQWKIRLTHEVLYGKYRSCTFVTMTFSDEYYSRFYDHPERAIRLFLDRFRKAYKRPLRHWFVTELGGATERLHFHGFVFDLPCSYEEFSRLWSYGYTDCSYVTLKRIGYAAKYSSKRNPLVPDYVPRVFASAGLGKAYAEHAGWKSHHLKVDLKDDKHYLIVGGYRYPMPRYYKDKIFDKERREDYRRCLESHPPEFSARFGKMQFTDPVEARGYRDRFYRETLALGASRKPRPDLTLKSDPDPEIDEWLGFDYSRK